MSQPQKLTIQEIREYVSDYAPNNYLIDGEEFTDTYIALCMSMAVDAYNALPPVSGYTLADFISKSILLYGTLWFMFNGKAILLARNHMSYSDGGLQIPIEERSQLYAGLAATFQSEFKSAATAVKVNQNMESGWGEVRSDYALFPMW